MSALLTCFSLTHEAVKLLHFESTLSLEPSSAVEAEFSAFLLAEALA